MSLFVLTAAAIALAQPAPSARGTAPATSATPRVVPPPAPPAPPVPGSRTHAQQRAERERRLSEACLSERGIRAILESEDRSQAAALRLRDEGRAIEEELGNAAHAAPLDLDRLERALAARTRYQADWQLRRDSERIALLRRLSPEDRAIFARDFTAMMVFPPPRRCLSSPFQRD